MFWKNLLLKVSGLLLLSAGLLAMSCGGGGSSSNPPSGGSGTYVVLAWNDLGMHCLNPSYDQAVILPPYNTVWAQVIRRGNPPQVVSSGVTVSYSLVGNTTSANKRSYGQFWTNCFDLFGQTLALDTGLNLEDPTIHNGLAGDMVLKGDHYQVNGIPVTPVNDAGVWNPYQVALITVKDGSGNVLAQTRATVPTSDEINCAKCHDDNVNPLVDVLEKHDASHAGLNLVGSAPVLCAECHGSPALGTSGAGSSGKYLSQAIHGFHASKGAACYDCHPGTTTQCNRSLPHTASDGNCTSCHGDMTNMASSIEGGRVPWASEPKCATCHNATTTIPEVDTGMTLYRNARGHGGVACAACHGSPHAMVPSREASDNYQMNQYMGALGASDPLHSMGSCGVCHSSSKPHSASDFVEEHGSERSSACSVCHTGFSDARNASKWPHAFQWKSR
ncbi:MAG: hypothetical protein H6Q00_1150 [Holophagaceae bacterium]|nr:hypothetical protein [Holophagaceae bacterium]